MHTRSLALLALPLLLLSACTPTGEPTAGDPPPAPTSKPTETVEPPTELDPDVLLVVTSTATADNGAVLDLSMTVRKATAWDDSGAPDRPALMTSTCEGYLDEGVYEPNLWSFLRVDVAAASDLSTATWPADKRIRLFPIVNDDVALASSGFLVEDPDVDAATPHCQRDRFLYEAGDGILIAGIQGDTDEVDAAGHFTRWANQKYGFVAHEVSGQTAAQAGMSLSDCTFTVTDAGTALHGGADWWGQLVNESTCFIGSNAP